MYKKSESLPLNTEILDMVNVIHGIGGLSMQNFVDDIHIHFPEGSNVNFDVLSTISEYFATKLIDIRSEVGHGGYCETCDYEYGYAVVVVRKRNMTPGGWIKV